MNYYYYHYYVIIIVVAVIFYDYPQFILMHINRVVAWPVHVIMQTTEAQIDLRIRAVLSAPLLSASKLV